MAKEETRKKILKAAEKLFSKNGYDGVPTKVIAKEAGITEMTLFNHFSNKELLYKTVVKERYLKSEVTSVFSQLTYESLEYDLLIIAEKLVENFENNRSILMMRLKEKESFQEDRDFKVEQDPLLGQIKPVFKVYQEKGIIKKCESSTTVLFLSTIKGLFYLCLMEDKKKEEVLEIIRFHVDTFCNGCMIK